MLLRDIKNLKNLGFSPSVIRSLTTPGSSIYTSDGTITGIRTVSVPAEGSLYFSGGQDSFIELESVGTANNTSSVDVYTNGSTTKVEIETRNDANHYNQIDMYSSTGDNYMLMRTNGDNLVKVDLYANDSFSSVELYAKSEIKHTTDAVKFYKHTASTLKVIFNDLPVYANEAAAVTGGLAQNTVYKTSTGELRIKL